MGYLILTFSRSRPDNFKAKCFGVLTVPLHVILKVSKIFHIIDNSLVSRTEVIIIMLRGKAIYQRFQSKQQTIRIIRRIKIRTRMISFRRSDDEINHTARQQIHQSPKFCLVTSHDSFANKKSTCQSQNCFSCLAFSATITFEGP